ncbi:MAG: D-sedoheptulose 7-phosphate isomerase [Candidatus Eremiobacteraeota bacterium]|nr:D-sedoheptulose 7-phosphate isomerase [Candidatus Eremiobacteraeota bacterium]
MESELSLALEESIKAKEHLREMIPSLAHAAGMMVEAFRRGNKILVCGNGGSAADAQHLAAELVGRFEMERSPLPCLALTTNTSNLTAIANDYQFSRIFEKQVEAFAAPGDIVIGISTSGTSENIVRALQAGKEKGALAIGFTGKSGRTIKKIAHLCLTAPSERTCRIQECHVTMIHLLCEQVEKAMASSAAH